MADNHKDGEHTHAHSHHGQGHDHDHAHGHAPHDWHSPDYVDYWIKRDEGRDEERRPRIRQMIAMAKLSRDSEAQVLDIGAGYGFVSEEVLRAFPKARVTLQDYSDLMLARAREHLARFSDQLAFVLADLTDPHWSARVGGPFDLAVSAIAIHNLRAHEKIAAMYRGVAGLLKPGAAFLDYDLFRTCGGVETNIAMMQEAGMTRVSLAWDDGHASIIVGHGKRMP